MYKISYSTDYLAHHGIIGQKWGVRNYQNKDGSLTAAGRYRYKMQQNRAIRIKKYAEKTGNVGNTIGTGIAVLSSRRMAKICASVASTIYSYPGNNAKIKNTAKYVGTASWMYYNALAIQSVDIGISAHRYNNDDEYRKKIDQRIKGE